MTRATLRAVTINGRFLSQPVSGVQRYAREIIRAFDDLLQHAVPSGLSSVTLLAPPNVQPAALPVGLQHIRVRQTGRLTGHLWEQLELPRLAHGSILLNLTSSAPLAHRRQLVAIHDAAIIRCPGDFDWKYRAWYRFLYAGLRRTPARFLTVSSFSASEVTQHFGIERSRISIVPNASEQFRSLAADLSVLDRVRFGRSGYILSVGSRSGRKNIGLVHQALAVMKDPPPLVIAGGAASKAFADSETGMGGEAVTLAHLSDEAIKALYQNALCLVFPSRYEGFGLPPVEAMTCGCPVITSNAASMPEICGDAALYCDPDRPDTLTVSIGRLLAEPGLRDKLIEAGFRRANAFSWASSAAKLLQTVNRMP